MNIFFDFDRIRNKNYPVDQDGLKDLLAECKKEPNNFSRKVDLIWNYVLGLYNDNSSLILDLSDETFKEQLTNELFLRLYNTLSTITSELISGADQFLDNTRFSSSKKRLTYMDKKSFNSFVNHLIPTPTEENFVSSIPGETTSLSKISSSKSSDLIIDHTPLSNFISTHLIYKGTDKEREYLLSESIKQNAKVKFYFNVEGRYFLSVLLLAVASKDIPYTSKTLYGSSLHSINNLFETFYYAYHQKELSDNLQEKFLFLINTESIFQYSLLYKIFSTLAEHFDTSKDKALPIFISSIPYITLLSSYRLNVAKIKMWDYLSENNFSDINKIISDINISISEISKIVSNINISISEINKITSKINIDISDISEIISEVNMSISDISKIISKVSMNFSNSPMETIDNIIDCFIYVLLDIEGYSDNCDSHFFNTFKKDIFEYLSKSKTQSMKWSLLSSGEKMYTKIPSIFNEYFNFYTLYYFYNIRFGSTNPSWNTKELEYSFDWPEYNLYTKYLLSHKK